VTTPAGAACVAYESRPAEPRPARRHPAIAARQDDTILDHARRYPASARQRLLSPSPIIAADNVAGEVDYLLSVVARDVSELQHVLAALATRGGQRLVTYLRLAEVKPASRLPLAAAARAPARAPRRSRRPVPADQHPAGAKPAAR
jgi:hypothetical protein